MISWEIGFVLAGLVGAIVDSRFGFVTFLAFGLLALLA